MNSSTATLTLSLLIEGLCLVPLTRMPAQGNASPSNADLERIESRMALERLTAEKKDLWLKLAASEQAVTSLQKNLAASNAELELWRRKYGELNLRLDALGIEAIGGTTSALEQRLLKAVSDLKIIEDERKRLHESLARLYEGVLQFRKVAVAEDPQARASLEVGMRTAARSLNVPSSEAAPGAAVPSTLTDGMVMSLKEDLNLVVANIGRRQGVRVGMPFQVLRGGELVGLVRVVDVREQISGAIIEDLSARNQTVKQGDRLKVAAQQ